MLALEKVDNVDPVCPHCEDRLRSIRFREIKGIAGRRYVYFCPSCSKVLGISHRKGFLMG